MVTDDTEMLNKSLKQAVWDHFQLFLGTICDFSQFLSFLADFGGFFYLIGEFFERVEGSTFLDDR
jgi:hypothetical protein